MVDSNTLILYVIGWVDRRQIVRTKVTNVFEESSYDLLLGLMAGFREVITTPNVLTEVSNLVNTGTTGRLRRKAFGALAFLVPDFEERFMESAQSVASDEFPRLGLTDATILEASEDCLVLTTDAGLYRAVWDRGRQALNFNHLRFPAP